MNPIRRRVTGPFLLCVPCIAAGCHREESPSRATVGLPSISAAPPVLIEAGPTPEAGPTAEATAPWPRIAVALDADKGRRALADYRKALASLCNELRSDAGEGAAKLKSFGLDGAEPASLCTDVDTAGEALASGSFEQPGADEVVLAVPSGMDRAAGDHALALMRGDGTSYRLVRPMVLGNNRFEARVRVAAASDRDVLMVCNPHGQEGVYPSTCGLFGSGSFQRKAGGNAVASDEIQLVDVTTCGPGASVRLGDVTLQGQRLRLALVVERFERDDPEGGTGDVCNRRVSRARSEFDVDYEINGDRLRRVTPMPREVVDLLKRY